MKKKTFSVLRVLIIVLCLLDSSYAQMSSANYRITTTVMSGGGAPMASTSFQMNSTLGQPSPLMEQGFRRGGLS
jgi:hypothetical protein